MPETLTAPAPPPSTPPPSPSPSPPPTAPPLGEAFDTSFPDDGLDTPPEPQPPPPVTPPPGDKGKAAPPKSGAPPKPAKAPGPEPTTPPPETDDLTVPEVGTFRDMRAFAIRAGAKARKAESEIQRLQSRISQLEQQPPKQADDAASLAQEVATLRKKIEGYENDQRLSNYERSEHYAQTYQKPYKEAVASAYRDVKELMVNGNPDDPDSTDERAATPADFDEIYSLPLGQATRLANRKFGDAAAIVLGHRAVIRKLAEAAYSAVEEYKTKGHEVESQQKAQKAQQDQARQAMFRAATEGHAKRSPDLFHERTGDKEGNDLLAKGKQFAAAVFGGDEGLTPQQVAFRDAMAYNRLSTYPRLLRDLKQARAELAEATKAIEGLRGSGPGAPGSGGGTKPDASGYKPFDQAFDELPA